MSLLRQHHKRAFKDACDTVAEFHRTFNYPVREAPPFEIPAQEARLRKNLCNEEAREVFDAIKGGNMAEVAKEVTDLEYVVAGTVVQIGLSPENMVPEAVRWLLDMCCARLQSGLENSDHTKSEMAAAGFMVILHGLADLYGLPLQPLREAVHESNMSKVGDDGKPVIRQSDGKMLKGPNYQPPDIAGVLAQHEAA